MEDSKKMKLSKDNHKTCFIHAIPPKEQYSIKWEINELVATQILKAQGKTK